MGKDKATNTGREGGKEGGKSGEQPSLKNSSQLGKGQKSMDFTNYGVEGVGMGRAC